MKNATLLFFVLVIFLGCQKSNETCDDGTVVYHRLDEPTESCFVESNYIFWHSEHLVPELIELSINGLYLRIDGQSRMSWATAFGKKAEPNCAEGAVIPISESVRKDHPVESAIMSTFEIFGNRNNGKADTLLMEGEITFSPLVQCVAIELGLD